MLTFKSVDPLAAELVINIIGGFGCFILLAASAIIMKIAVHRLHQRQVINNFFYYTLEGAAMLVYMIDLLCFVLFTGYHGLHFALDINDRVKRLTSEHPQAIGLPGFLVGRNASSICVLSARSIV
jgi:hypothetical protein